MKCNQWTRALAAAGVVSLGSVVSAEEAASQVLTALSSTTLSGYVDTSVIWKPGTGNGALPGRAFDGATKLDGFNLNVVELQLEKPLEEGNWSAGYKVELLFGPDANLYNTSPAGLSFGGSSDFSIKDAYVALRAPVGNGLDIKVGSFATILGYEVYESGSNPNYSRSFGWLLEPTQHTGVLASYRFNDWLSASAGIANTHLAGINLRSPRAESHKTYMGSITVTAPESAGVLSGASFYAGAMEGFAGNAGKDSANLYAGAALPTPLEGLSVGIAYDYRFNGPNGVTPAGVVGSNWAWAAAGYLSYQATEKVKVNARVDYVTGSDGTFYDAGAGGSDRQNEIIAPTLTLDYVAWENVLSRVEVRWDHTLSSDRIYGGGLNADPDRNAVTVALNIIYKF